MDAERRARWVTALRSGEYKQTLGLLRDNANKMCCLGVAINEFAPHRWRHEQGQWSDADGDECMPGERTREALGLTDSESRALAELNDDGLSFGEIANHIERNERLDTSFDDQLDKERDGSSSRTN